MDTHLLNLSLMRLQTMEFVQALWDTKDLSAWQNLANQIKEEGFTHGVLLGMGGSSLFPQVCTRLFQEGSHFRLLVLDSLIPEAVLDTWNQVKDKKTLYIISSKSGSTLEVQLLEQFFYEQCPNPKHFMAITDAGSPLEALAKSKNYRAILYGNPQIGGRFSALSAFGLFVAFLLDMPVFEMLQGAQTKALGLLPQAPKEHNQALLVTHTLWKAYKEQAWLCLDLNPEQKVFGLWLEQLFCESLGKAGKGFVVDANPVTAWGHVHRVLLPQKEDLFYAVYLYEIVVALLGDLMQINPFDQPQVELSKQYTRQLLKQPIQSADTSIPVFKGVSQVHLLAFLPESFEGQLNTLRKSLFQQGVLSTLGFGPRYLHSTGQSHKGGAHTGLFWVLTSQTLTQDPLGQVAYSQALGDIKALKELGRKVAHTHFQDPKIQLQQLSEELESCKSV